MSPITVSRVINKPELVSAETRARVLQVIDEMGFVLNRLASSFSRATSRIVGTVAPPIINFGIAEQVQGMSDVFSTSDYQLLVSPGELSGDHEGRQVMNMLGWQPAGMVLQAFSESDSMRETLRARGLPVVEISEIFGKDPIDCVVGISNHEAARRMTLFLAECGYKRIAFMGAVSHGNDRATRRTLGYRAAMAELGRKPIDVIGPLRASYAAEGLREILELQPDTDAIFCASDTFAIAAVQECQRRGLKVPGRSGLRRFRRSRFRVDHRTRADDRARRSLQYGAFGGANAVASYAWRRRRAARAGCRLHDHAPRERLAASTRAGVVPRDRRNGRAPCRS